MWGLVPRSVQITLISLAALVTAWAAEAVYESQTGHPVWIVKWYSLSATGISVLLVALMQLLWRPLWAACPRFGRWVFPDLNGRWQGVVVSTWVDPATGQSPPPIATTVWIRQGLFKTTIKLKTNESVSHSTRAILEPARDYGGHRIWYSYNNDPAAHVRHRSSPHEGVAFLEFDMTQPKKLTGTYYTARKTSGDMMFDHMSNSVSD